MNEGEFFARLIRISRLYEEIQKELALLKSDLEDGGNNYE